MARVSLIKSNQQRKANSWTLFKERITDLIREALLILRQKSELSKGEFKLNRMLYLCISEANLKFDLPLPAYDARNPPHSTDKQKVKREDNRPDLYWTLMDHEANYQDWNRTFVLECKRLGEKTSPKWILTEQYVIGGILRFFHEEKGYGKGCEIGAMVAYVQDMDFDQILNQINFFLSSNEPSISPLATPLNGWKHQGVSFLNHSFNRSFIPTYFSLQHFWVDMKDCLYLPSSIDDDDEEQENQLPVKEKAKKQSKKSANKKNAKDQKSKLLPKETFQMELPMEIADSSATEYHNLGIREHNIDS